MELKWSKHKSESKVFTKSCFLCVLIMWSAGEGADFILGEVLQIEGLVLSGRGSSLVQMFGNLLYISKERSIELLNGVV